MASLRRKELSPYWFACFTDADGTRAQRSTKQTDRRKAQAVANAYEKAARLARQRLLGEAQARRVISDIYEAASGQALNSATARDYLTNWPDSVKGSVSARTYQAYRQVVREFLAVLGQRADLDLSQVSRADVVKYRDKVAESRSSSTANKHLKYLRVALGAAWRSGFIQDNPAAKVERLQRRDEESVQRRPFTLHELRQIYRHASSEWRGMLLFGFFTGQRLADIGSLRWNNLDLESGLLRFVTRKTGRRMEIPLVGQLRDYVAHMPVPSQHPEAPLFPAAHRIATSETGDSRLSQQFHSILVAAGLAKPRTKDETGLGRSRRRAISEVSFHSLRHTATSLLKTAGVPRDVVMDIIGHDSEAVSRLYTHIDADAKRAALAQLPEISAAIS